MLPKKLKIKRRHFPEVLSKGKTLHSNHLSLRFHSKISKKNKEQLPVFVFVVSKKVSNKATERNLLKRRGYTAIKRVLPHIKQPATCVFYFKKESCGMKYKELKIEVVGLLKKAGII